MRSWQGLGEGPVGVLMGAGQERGSSPQPPGAPEPRTGASLSNPGKGRTEHLGHLEAGFLGLSAADHRSSDLPPMCSPESFFLDVLTTFSQAELCAPRHPRAEVHILKP